MMIMILITLRKIIFLRYLQPLMKVHLNYNRHLKYDDPHKFVKNLNEKNKENYKNKNVYI